MQEHTQRKHHDLASVTKQDQWLNKARIKKLLPSQCHVCVLDLTTSICPTATARSALLAGSMQLTQITYPEEVPLPCRQITQSSRSRGMDTQCPCCSPLWSQSSAHATLTVLPTHLCFEWSKLQILNFLLWTTEYTNIDSTSFCPATTLKTPKPLKHRTQIQQ